MEGGICEDEKDVPRHVRRVAIISLRSEQCHQLPEIKRAGCGHVHEDDRMWLLQFACTKQIPVVYLSVRGVVVSVPYNRGCHIVFWGMVLFAWILRGGDGRGEELGNVNNEMMGGIRAV